MKINFRKIGLKKLDTYIMGKFLGTFFYSIILIISISIVFDLTEKIDDFFDNNAPLSAIVFDYYLNFIPFYVNMFTPLFTFISVIFYRDWETDRKSTRLNSSHRSLSRMPSSA